MQKGVDTTELDEDGKDEEGILRSHWPIYDRIGIRCINFLLFGFYFLMSAGGVAGIVLPTIWPNFGWPVLISFIIVALLIVLHITIMVVGKVTIPGYLLYPVSPKWIYMVSDGVLVFMLVGTIAAFVLNPLSPILPMITAWVVTVAGLIQLHKVWRITYEGPELPPPVEYVDPPGTAWRKFREGLEKSGF